MEKIKLKRFLVAIILFIVTLTSLNCLGLNLSQPESDFTDDTIEYADTYCILSNCTNKIDSIEYKIINQRKNEVRNQIIAEVKKYVGKQSPSAHQSISENIVTQCLDNQVDICFVMSQTQIETNFGTTGAGRPNSRRSIFGVAKRYYTTYENAISDYIDILKENYLANGRTEQQLMKNYVTVNGYRYASSTNYEKHLSKTYNDIKAQTNIYILQKHYQSM